MALEKKFKIFSVEDDPIFARMLKYWVELDPENEIVVFGSGREFLDNIHQNPSAVTLDYQLPDMSGEELITRIKNIRPNLPVIVVSGQQNIKTAVQLLKHGAEDYIIKDPEASELFLNAVNRLKSRLRMVDEIEDLRVEIGRKYDFDKTIIGNSPQIRKILVLLEKAAKTQITVSITGETGTGKEVVAKAIHYASDRKTKPFVPVNVAAIPAELIESELFGYEKGAFTGAVARRIGKFEEANKGTLFLDEIGEMPANMQAKLLRALQEREVTRIGGNQTVKFDLRLIVATHRNLAEEVRKGNFREDLYYRLLGLSVALPPLRERGDDILILAKKFLKDSCKENKIPEIKINQKAAEKLMNHSWPGNVRELKAVMELATVMASDNEVQPDDIIFSQVNELQDFLTQEQSLDEYIYKIVRFYLTKYDQNIVKVAEVLKIGKSTIYRYLKEMEALGI